MKNYTPVFLIISIAVLNSSTASNLIIISLCILLFVYNIENILKFWEAKIILVLNCIAAIIIGSSLNAPIESSRLIVLLLVMLPFPYEFRINKKQHVLIFCSCLYVIIFQFGDALEVNFVKSMINTYYPIANNPWQNSANGMLNNLGKNRYAGIYFNPNIMGQSMVLLFAILIQYVEKNYNKVKTVLVSILFMFSIVLTGSRSSMITFMIINLFFLRKLINVKYLIFLFPIIFFVFLASDFSELERSMRVFKLDLYGSENSSGNVKIRIFLNWVESNFTNDYKKLPCLLFGIGAIPTVFDFDFGYLAEMLGFVGILIFVYFIVRTFHNTTHKYIYYIFFISIGATLIVNFRFSIMTLIILSIYQRRSEI